MKKHLCYIIITASSLVCGYADEVKPLVGSTFTVKEEMVEATDVVIGKFTKAWGGAAGSMMGMWYHGQITVSETLKGNESGNVEVGFWLTRGPRGTELVPNLNDTYIMILVQDHHEIGKLLPATDDNIAMIKQLIAKNAVSQPPVTQPVNPVDQSASPQPTPVPETPSPTPTPQPSIPPEPPVANETSETSIPIWTYGIIPLSLILIGGLWYFLRARK